jgi:hypothetical protein
VAAWRNPARSEHPAGEGHEAGDAGHDRLAFDHADRLPWLEGDDDEDYAGLTASA